MGETEERGWWTRKERGGAGRRDDAEDEAVLILNVLQSLVMPQKYEI